MPGTTVRAAVSRTFGAPLEIESVDLAPPSESEVRVRVAAVAICHSDIFFIDGAWGGRLPAVWGHEAAGVVDEVGEGVDDLAVGTRVVVTLVRSCGSCRHCTRGAEVACSTSFGLDEASPVTDTSGTSITHGLRTAAFAEAVVVHRSQLVPVDEDLPLDSASLLACGVLTGVGAVFNTAQVEPDSHVVVIGTGGVGLNTIQGARIAGAATVTAVDLNPEKLEAAVPLGATHTVDAAADDAAAQVWAITAGELADYVFVTTGASSAVDGAYRFLAPTGALVLVGMPPSGVTSELDTGTLASLNQRILGSKMGSARVGIDIPMLVSLYQEGDLEIDGLISGRYGLDEINDGIESVRRGEALRNVVIVDPTLVSA